MDIGSPLVGVTEIAELLGIVGFDHMSADTSVRLVTVRAVNLAFQDGVV